MMTRTTSTTTDMEYEGVFDSLVVEVCTFLYLEEELLLEDMGLMHVACVRTSIWY